MCVIKGHGAPFKVWLSSLTMWEKSTSVGLKMYSYLFSSAVLAAFTRCLIITPDPIGESRLNHLFFTHFLFVSSSPHKHLCALMETGCAKNPDSLFILPPGSWWSHALPILLPPRQHLQRSKHSWDKLAPDMLIVVLPDFCCDVSRGVNVSFPPSSTAPCSHHALTEETLVRG